MQPWSRLPIIFLAVSFVTNFLLRPFHLNADAILGEHSGPLSVLLLTAHPDDECMFFAPTILSLFGLGGPRLGLGSSSGSDVQLLKLYSLCLSVGDADGLGKTRKDELWGSLDVLGIPDGMRWVVDRPDLQDNFTATWDAEVIASTVMPYVTENNIDVILTFDRGGISSHPNHISLLHGATHLLSSLSATRAPRLFSLVSEPLYKKYLGPLAPLLAKAQSIAAADRRPTFVSGLGEYIVALRAMMQHRSQLVWFRWLYVAFSRYMWVNEWVEIAHAIQL